MANQYWQPDITEAVEEAFERCGIEARTGYHLRTARRSINIMLTEWANRGYNMWTVVEDMIPLEVGRIEYELPPTTVDVIEQVIRQYPDNPAQQIDLQITRIALPTYATIPNKENTGRPIQVYYDRLTPIPKFKIWPAANQTGYYFVYWRLARNADVGKIGTDQFENIIPYRFYPAFISGLSYYLSMKIPDAEGRIEMLKAMYEEDWKRAADEDREKAPVKFIPHIAGTGWGGW